jgi:hypothetical protein
VAAPAVAILCGFVIWSHRHSVDPQVVGRWTRDMRNQSGQWQGRLLIGRDNTYRIETIVKDHGRLVATAGTFRMVSNTQTSAVGSYRVVNADSLEVTSAVGKVVWRRRGPAPPAPRASPMVGEWDVSPVIGGITWHQIIDATPDSAYALTSVTGDSGGISASAGQWHMSSRSGRESDGTYTLAGSGQLTVVAPEGRSVWRRDTVGTK